MTRIPAALLALCALSTPALAEDRHYAIGDFDRVTAEGPYIVHLVTGRATSAVAHGSREALDRMSLDVQGQMLRIRRNRGAWSGGTGGDPGPVTIDLVTRSVRSVRLLGPARFDADNVRGLRVEFSVEGSGTLHATRLNADALSLALLGSGRLDIAGAARTVAGTFQGTGDVAAPGLVAHSATVASTTSGAVALTVNGPATIANDGLGNVRILGRAVCTISGSAADQVRCGGSDQGQNR
jgi:putative autotransporter adhesin-like protein